ncbi:MAG: hypothetical protein H8F28_26470 [Fibrella sp.]|nr:hypothetical protein [Armatimonadota bacterium]
MAIVVLFTAVGRANAMWFAIRLDELVQRSDMIARVQVVDNRRNPTVIKDWTKNETEKKYGGNIRLFYHWVARARVIDPIYGCKRGETVLIYHNNDSSGCPGVGYGTGEDVTVFLLYQNGAYNTINWTNGKRSYTTPKAHRELKSAIQTELRKLAHPGNAKLRGSALHLQERRESEAERLRLRERNRTNNLRR